MSLVVDASVFVTSARTTEENYATSRRFLSLAAAGGESVSAPILALPECAGAIGRLTGSHSKARRMVLLLKRIPALQFAPVSEELAEAAAEVAGICRLRGSDSCYVALAADLGATLITWDGEMLERGAAVVTTQTPAQWLQDQAGNGTG